MNQNNELSDEGQEVSLIPGGISFTSPRKIDVAGFQKWIAGMTSELPSLLEEKQVAEMMSDMHDAFLEKYMQDKLETAIPGYSIIDASVLTRLTIGALLFDDKVEIVPQVQQMLDMCGYCPVLRTYHSTDFHYHQNTNPGGPYLGRIKIFTFNDLFY